LNVFHRKKGAAMKHFNVRVLIVSLCLGICSAFLFAGAALGRSCEQWGGKIVSVQGVVQVRKAGESKWIQVRLNETYCPRDMIRVLKNSRAAIVLSNETLFRLDQNTTVTFTGVEKEKTFLIDIFKGVTHFFSRHPRRLKVVTPFLNAAVEGTEFYVRVAQDQTFLSIFEGRVAASNKAGSLVLTGGQSAVAEAGKTPVLQVVVRPRDAVQWALYYLPVMYVPPGEAPKKDMSDPQFLAYRASQLLAVGRVDEAGADIERALSLNPNYSDAFALQSIIAVVQNEKDKALSAAQKAIDTGPNSATARIAMSYAQQAGFDLERARASVEEAVKLDPNNALAWARLAELWSSFGRLGKALDAAKKAVDLNPNLARTQMVLGFAYLTQVKTTESKAAFEKAIELDQADPLSRLGLGLAKIRDGDLQAGGREIEIAASLDPNNSLVRSYLGKTYFEEKRTDLDGREYAIAKELDPNDPTPWFYDAIRKQTINRPVEALHDLQKAKELNDNRAVYRSKLLLDADEAARSASLARIYSNLGFQQRALVEGWQSVNTDPTNFSAHRFLADSYSVRPRHEIARVSELLQSQLLQPLNITPIQPRLAESNQFLINAGGPAGLSFNEFNPLFNRNRIAVQGSGLVGENDTRGVEGVVSGIYKKFSFSGGYTHFDTDGWRDNADQTDKIANVFAQMQLTYKTSIQAEYRYRDNERGDTRMRFFEDDFFPRLNQEDKTKSARIGFHHAFSPGSDLIGNFSYQDVDRDVEDSPDPVFVPLAKIEGDDDAYGGELQYLFRSQYINLVTGAGYFDIDSQEKVTEEFAVPFPPFIIRDQFTDDLDVHHTNVYLYSYIKPLKNLTLTIGGSGDFFDGDSDAEKDKDQFNPKFGIIWSPFTNTTLRAAAFRTLKRTLITDQTIEPTQVAGFNQFFDDLNATDVWHYGGAIDQKFSESIYGGAEYTYRDLDTPFFPDGVKTANWDEQTIRAYLFWTPHDWLAFSAEYLYEDFDRDKDFAFGAKDLRTHYVPLGINFFHPSGLSASLKGTYIDQDGKFEKLGNPGTFEDGDDNFWLVDAAVSYRFPKRYGFFTVGVTNLFNEDFEHFDTDLNNPRVQPDRSFFVKVTLALP
jgi:tetratricopeptide (TPR) repeat protein